jgi:hypothetical protein
VALATTTLSSAVSATDTNIVVASATSVAGGRLIIIDQEVMRVVSSYVSGTTVGVQRGQDGSATVAHKVTANVTHGTAADFAQPAATMVTTYAPARARVVQSLTAAATLTLPPAGTDLVVILNGTSVIALTIPVPTKDMDGTELSIIGNGAAAHTLTFTGGLSGAGTSYDVITVNATAPIAFKAVACNGLWTGYVGVPLAGTVTNITGTVA